MNRYIISKKQGKTAEVVDSDVLAELNGPQIDSVEESTRRLGQNGCQRNHPRLTLIGAAKFSVRVNFMQW